jgi:predicted HicB family RNase H-like nuclease
MAMSPASASAGWCDMRRRPSRTGSKEILRKLFDILSVIKYIPGMKKRKRMGRPPLAKAKRKSVKVFFRTTPSFHKTLVNAAKQEGKPLATYISDTLEELLAGGE